MPEEMDYREIVKVHPGVRKLKKLYPEKFNAPSTFLNKLTKEGGRIVRSEKPDILRRLKELSKCLDAKARHLRLVP
jgi:hypothetical protein